MQEEQERHQPRKALPAVEVSRPFFIALENGRRRHDEDVRARTLDPCGESAVVHGDEPGDRVRRLANGECGIGGWVRDLDVEARERTLDGAGGRDRAPMTSSNTRTGAE